MVRKEIPSSYDMHQMFSRPKGCVIFRNPKLGYNEIIGFPRDSSPMDSIIHRPESVMKKKKLLTTVTTLASAQKLFDSSEFEVSAGYRGCSRFGKYPAKLHRDVLPAR